MANNASTTDIEAQILAGWRALMSPAEAERIGPATFMVMAHEAARAVTRAATSAGSKVQNTTLCLRTLDAVEKLLQGDAVFYLPRKMRGMGGPDCPDGDPPGAGWCQTSVDLMADTRARAVDAIRALAGKEPLADDE